MSGLEGGSDDADDADGGDDDDEGADGAFEISFGGQERDSLKPKTFRLF